MERGETKAPCLGVLIWGGKKGGRGEIYSKTPNLALRPQKGGLSCRKSRKKRSVGREVWEGKVGRKKRGIRGTRKWAENRLISLKKKKSNVPSGPRRLNTEEE